MASVTFLLIILSEVLVYNPSLQAGIRDHLERWQMGWDGNPLIFSSLHFHKCQHYENLAEKEEVTAKAD